LGTQQKFHEAEEKTRVTLNIALLYEQMNALAGFPKGNLHKVLQQRP